MTAAERPEAGVPLLRIERPTLLEHTHTSPGSWMRYELEATDEGTLLRATYFVPEPDAAVQRGDIVGGHYGFDRLESALAGRPDPFDLEAFAALPERYSTQGLASVSQE